MRDEDTEYLLGSRETITPHPPPPQKKIIKPDLHQFQE